MTEPTDPEQPPSDEGLDQLHALVDRVRRRVNVQTGLDRATTGGTVAVMFATVALVLWKTHWLAFGDFAVAAAGLALLPLAAFASAWLHNRDPVELAQHLDRSHELHDRLSTALALVREGQTDEFSAAQLRDALDHTDAVEPERAAPFRRPNDLPLLAAFLAMFAVLALLRPPSHAEPLPEPPQIKHDPVLDSATLAMEKEQIEEMKEELEGTDDPETKQLVEEIEKLLEKVEKRQISGREFLDRLEEIKKRHFEGDEAGKSSDDSDALSEALKKAAKNLEKESSKALKEEKELKKTVEALKNEDLEKASKSLEKLGKKLLNKDNIDPERLKKMAKMFEKFSKNLEMDDEKLQKMLDKHKDLVDKLSKKLKNQGNLSRSEKRRLERAKKKSKQLRKKLNSDSRSEQKRQLEQLRRKTEKASKKMKKAAKEQKSGSSDENEGQTKQANRGEQQKEKGQKGDKGGQQKGQKKNEDSSDYRRQAGRDVQKSSKKLDEQARRKRAKNVRQSARKQLEELKRSMERSRPQRAEKSSGQGSSQSGESGKKGEKMREYIRKAQGKSGSSDSKNQGGENKTGSGTPSGKKGESSGKKGDQKSKGKGKQKRASNSEQSNAPGDQPGGKALGEEGESPRTEREKKKMSGQKGEGPSRSKVIQSASEKGFATREYKEVYGDYSSVVEEVMEREDVPDGYRYYVKRYFELIKPRD